MTPPLTLTAVISRLANALEAELPLQNLTADHPLYGAIISPEHWLDEAGHVGTTRFVVRCGCVVLGRLRGAAEVPAKPSQEMLLERMHFAVDYLLRVQRPSGLIDLRSTNYESGPDTAFALQLICAFIELAAPHPELASLSAKLTSFAHRAALGVMASGFHTPNHRWVIAGALAMCAALIPALDAQPVIDRYLDEGIDIDGEGAYLERSIAVYDAVTNRSLMLVAEHTADAARAAALLDVVARNLEFDLHLLHGDDTAETGLSTRQDYGQRVVPTTLIAPYLQAGLMLNDQRFIGAAGALWERGGDTSGDLEWQCRVLLKYGEPDMTHAVPIPTAYTRAFPGNRLWRFRQGDLSASVFGGRTRLLHLVYRSAAITAVKIAQAYFSVGLFIADTMEMDGEGVLLRSSGRQKANLPAYHLPLGRPVAPEDFEASKAEREHKRFAPADSILKITPVEGGLDLHYRTLDGLDDVIAQIALDFPAGGLWETDDTVFSCPPGAVIFLKQGTGRMRFGTDVIEISGGCAVHLSQAMRHSEPAGEGQVRVLLTFTTPVDHRFSLRVRPLLGG